jgi:hypothetical protein
VRLLRRDQSAGRVTFRFERGEREMFTQVLDLFPLKKDSMRPISEDSQAQALLEKALHDERAKIRDDVQKLLRTSGELVIDPDFNEFWDLKVTDAEIEWLLQILNNIRVGLWYQLGCPQPTADVKLEAALDDQLVRGHVIMQLCAAWEGMLISAAQAQDDSQDDPEPE